MDFEIQKWTSERFSEIKITFQNIPEYSRVVPACFYTISYDFNGKSMNNAENYEKFDFDTKSLTSIPFGVHLICGGTVRYGH